MPYTLEFEIPGLPKLINAQSRGHWAVGWREAKKWKFAVRMFARPNRPEIPLKRARITLTRFSCSKSGPDVDNLAGSWKHVQDGLKDAGIIEDDSPAHIEAIYEWRPCGRGQGRIRVKIEEIN
jgi:Holliday junction resolvase RusA-like endonuclease